MRALVIDDSGSLRTLYQVFLHELGFVTDEAHDGRVALARLEQDRYDLILCDLEMPVMDGMTFYAELLESAPELLPYLVFATGADPDGPYADFFNSTCCPVLQKPFSLYALKTTLEEALGRPLQEELRQAS